MFVSLESILVSPSRNLVIQKTKKADVAEHPQEFRDVGLLYNRLSAVTDRRLFSLPINSIQILSRVHERFARPHPHSFPKVSIVSLRSTARRIMHTFQLGYGQFRIVSLRFTHVLSGRWNNYRR